VTAAAAKPPSAEAEQLNDLFAANRHDAPITGRLSSFCIVFSLVFTHS
jgi:hypothetical protein